MSQNTHAGQPSIRSFFQPAQPKYAAPPSASSRLAAQVRPPPPPQDTPPTAPPLPVQSLPPPPPPPLPPSTTSLETRRPTSTPTPTHHPNITLSPIDPTHIPALRSLTSRLLPVRYPATFYASLTDPLTSGAYSRVLLWTEAPSVTDPDPRPVVIGGLVCRPERSFQARPRSALDVVPDALYIQSLVLQEPYRGLGLAAAALDEVCRLASPQCRTVVAHVWVENQDGMEWYRARGFRRVEPVVEGYYSQLQPGAAWIVKRDIGSGANANGVGGGSVTAALNGVRANGASNGDSEARSGPGPANSALASAPPRAEPRPGAVRSPGSGQSFQNTRPETEWNDLPADMQTPRNSSNNLSVPGSGATSAASSRSSSAVRKKRDRAYPAAAFGA